MSGLVYERGNPDQPVGHAFVYFGARGDQQVLATYLVVPPIRMDLSKYMPAVLSSALGPGLSEPRASFLPVPPVPEPMELAQILGLAELRGDDILVGGFGPVPEDPALLLAQVVEIGEAYAASCRESLQPEAGLRRAQRPSDEPSPGRESPQVRALLYATVSERERLEALARELGSLRYGIEVGDSDLVESALSEMEAIATSLPDKYRAHELLEVAPKADADAVRLAQLYLERGFKLCAEEYESLAVIDQEIARLHGRPS